jgi:hypothetical protein
MYLEEEDRRIRINSKMQSTKIKRLQKLTEDIENLLRLLLCSKR